MCLSVLQSVCVCAPFRPCWGRGSAISSDRSASDGTVGAGFWSVSGLAAGWGGFDAVGGAVEVFPAC